MAATRLPEDIDKEILSKLPVESLVRFKLVSKSWYSLISNRQFIKLHLRHSAESDNNHLFIIDEGSTAQLFITSVHHFYELADMEFLYRHHPYLNKYKYWILCSCDGLLMIRKHAYWQPNYSFIIVWNPATRESPELPKLMDDFCYKIICGLGYDRSTDDYKVVYGAFDKAVDKFTLMVFSLKFNSWRKNQVLNYTILSISRVHHVNGVLYWMICSRDGEYLIGFKLAEEKLMELPLPDDVVSADEERGCEIVLGDLKGRLCLSQSVHENPWEFHSLNVWLMKEDGNEAAAACWTKLFTLPPMPVGITYWPNISVSRFFCFSKQAVIVMTNYFNDSAALVFDVEKHTLVEARSIDGPGVNLRRTLTFFQSLVSPK